MPRRANRGSFQPGHDPRRHFLTREERRRGYRAALEKLADNVKRQAWLLRRVRGWYRARRRRNT